MLSQFRPDGRWRGLKDFIDLAGMYVADRLDADSEGLLLTHDGLTPPAKARMLAPPPALWQREPPVRVRQAIPTAWLELVIREGRNRQVRRMTAAVGFPTLRLVRANIGPASLDDLAPGSYRELDPARLT